MTTDAIRDSDRETPLMVFDVESVGLHGEGFAVGWAVIDRQSGREIGFGEYGCNPQQATGFESDREWVRANVTAKVNCETPAQVRSEFWGAWCWLKFNYPGAVLVSDVPWPVEAARRRSPHERA